MAAFSARVAPRPSGSGCGDVVRVGGHRGAGQLGVDPRAAGQGVLFGFQHQGAGAFAHDEAVTVEVVGPGGALGIVVAAGERLHRGERRNRHRVDGRFGAAAHDDVGLAGADQVQAHVEGLGAGGAGGDRGVGAGTGAQVEADRRRDAVGHQHGHGHRQDTAGALFAQGVPRVQEGPDAADAGGEGHGEPVMVDFGDAGVRPGLAGGDDGELAWTGPCRLASTRLRTSGAGVVARAAKWTGSSYLATQSSSRVRAPETPFSAFFHIVGTSPPMGVVAPRPVMTTLRVMGSLSVGAPAVSGTAGGGRVGLGGWPQLGCEVW